jgi:hypothetical protein
LATEKLGEETKKVVQSLVKNLEPPGAMRQRGWWCLDTRQRPPELVGDVDTLPEVFDERCVNQVLRGVFTGRGGEDWGYDSELGVFITAILSMRLSPKLFA